MTAYPKNFYKDPSEVLQDHESKYWKQRRGCSACTHRPRMFGGDGECKVLVSTRCKRFDLDGGG